MIGDFLNFLADGVFDFLTGFFSIFPQMPFSASDLEDLIDVQSVSTVLGWVNYFLPLDIASEIMALWATAMMAYVAFKLSVKYSEGIVK